MRRQAKRMMPQDHWLPGFNFNVEEWLEGDRYKTLAICHTLALARAAFTVAVEEKPHWPVHDPQPDARSEAAPGGPLVRV
jgi:hypothetical protein